jgi:predicted nucleotidyltransferase
MKPDPAMLDEVVRRTVRAVHPMRIVLFGSAARGEMGPNSDLNILVVMPDGCDRRAVAGSLYRAYRGLAYAHDVVVVWQDDVERYGQNPYLIIHTAMSEGKELYRVSA